MRRLGTHILLALLVVALVSLTVVPLATLVAERMTFNRLPTEFRESVFQRLTPPPVLGRLPSGQLGGDERFHGFDLTFPGSQAAPAGLDGTEMTGLRRENQRLFTLFSDMRAMQRRAVLVGIAVALLLCTAIALWISRTIARPLEAVSHAASRLANGELATRVAPLGPWQSHETQALASGFNAMAGSLERLEGERKAMIADVAHELRTPLAAMSMRLEALEDGLVPFDASELELLRGHTDLLSRLIDDLRLLSLADAGRLPLNLEELDLVPWLNQAARAQEIAILDHGARLTTNIMVESAVVNADPQRLRQVLQNLLDNAAKASTEGGIVEVTLSTAKEHAYVSVRDEGPGIPEEELETIFQRFVQGRRRDTGATGSGLGLAIVRTLVTLHDGEVAARNHANGAEFVVTLPLANLAGGPATAPPQKTKPSDSPIVEENS